MFSAAFIVACPALAVRPVGEDFSSAPDDLQQLAAIYDKWQQQQPLQLTWKQALSCLTVANLYNVEDFYRHLIRQCGRTIRYRDANDQPPADMLRGVRALSPDIQRDIADVLAETLDPLIVKKNMAVYGARCADLAQTFQMEFMIATEELKDPRTNEDGSEILVGGLRIVDGKLQTGPPPQVDRTIMAAAPELSDGMFTCWSPGGRWAIYFRYDDTLVVDCEQKIQVQLRCTWTKGEPQLRWLANETYVVYHKLTGGTWIAWLDGSMFESTFEEDARIPLKQLTISGDYIIDVSSIAACIYPLYKIDEFNGQRLKKPSLTSTCTELVRKNCLIMNDGFVEWSRSAEHIAMTKFTVRPPQYRTPEAIFKVYQ